MGGKSWSSARKRKKAREASTVGRRRASGQRGHESITMERYNGSFFLETVLLEMRRLIDVFLSHYPLRRLIPNYQWI